MLILDRHDVTELLSLPDCITAVEEAVRRPHGSLAPRLGRLHLPQNGVQ